jgi:hypothetical protein
LVEKKDMLIAELKTAFDISYMERFEILTKV